MPQLSSDERTRQRPLETPGAVATLPPATLARRRRLLRWGGLATFVLGLALSALPGPKGGSDVLKTVVENGAPTQVHQFFFSRHYGLPFSTGRTDYNDDGTIRDFRIEAQGFLGNLGAALAIVIAASIFIGRRRRGD